MKLFFLNNLPFLEKKVFMNFDVDIIILFKVRCKTSNNFIFVGVQVPVSPPVLLSLWAGRFSLIATYGRLLDSKQFLFHSCKSAYVLH